MPIGQAVELEYKLNRSTDGGKTWSFGNQPLGTVVAQACSDQGVTFNSYSFGVPEPGIPNGRVNLLKGGIHSLAVDPQDGAVYVVYGAFDEGDERDQLKIVRVTSDGGVVNIGVPVLVSPAHRQAALPAVAVTENGAVGVLYDTADGLVGDPEVHHSAHLAVSRDHGQTFSDSVILHFRSPVPDFGDRLLGDYQQLKAVGEHVLWGLLWQMDTICRVVSIERPARSIPSSSRQRCRGERVPRLRGNHFATAMTSAR